MTGKDSSINWTGISDGFKIGSPISTVAPSIPLLPKEGCTSNTPAPVSTDITLTSGPTKPSEIAKATKQRIPLPHISPSDPSALNIRILRSAMVDGAATIRPSAPIPLCLSLIFSEISGQSRI